MQFKIKPRGPRKTLSPWTEAARGPWRPPSPWDPSPRRPPRDPPRLKPPGPLGETASETPRAGDTAAALATSSAQTWDWASASRDLPGPSEGTPAVPHAPPSSQTRSTAVGGGAPNSHGRQGPQRRPGALRRRAGSWSLHIPVSSLSRALIICSNPGGPRLGGEPP